MPGEKRPFSKTTTAHYRHFLNDRIRGLKPSPTLELTAKTKALMAEGKDIINLTAGEPDFNSIPAACTAGIRAIEEGFTKYTAVDGLSELKKAIITRMESESSEIFHENEVIIGNGAKQLIFNALFATLSSGDEVIIPSPYWVSYPDIVKLLGGKPIIVSVGADQNFSS